MKIVHIVNYFLPEMGYQENYLAKKQAAMGHEVHVLTSNRAYPNYEEYKKLSSFYPQRKLPTGTFKQDGYMVHRLGAVGEKNMQLFLKGLFSKLKHLEPDLVIMHGFTRYEALRLGVWKILNQPRFRLIVDDHSLYVVHKRNFYRRVYHLMVRSAFKLFDAVGTFDRIVPVTDETADLLYKEFGVPKNKMTMIPIGADCDQFQFSAAARAKIRKELNIPENAVVLAYIGKISAERGVNLAVDMALPLIKKHQNLYLLFVGSGYDSDFANGLKEEISIEGVGKKVVWHPQVHHGKLHEYYCAADIAVWPAYASMACLEAAACGLPVILANLDVCRERTSEGNGYIWTDTVTVRKRVENLITDNELRKDMGRKGAEMVRRKYDWNVIAKRFLEV